MKSNFDRKQRATLVAALVLAVGLAGGAQAAINTWTGPDRTGNWDTTGNNWAGTPAGTPWSAQGNDALFDTANNIVTVTANIAVDNWSIGSSGNRVTLNSGSIINENYNFNPGPKFLIFGPNHASIADGNILTILGTFNFGPTGNYSGSIRLGSDGSVGSSYNGIVVNTNGTLLHVTPGGGTKDDEVGIYAGANYNYMDINGGTFDRRTGTSQFTVGGLGSYNYMTIRNGGTFTGNVNMPTAYGGTGNSKLHIGTDGSFNHVDVTGTASIARVAELLTVGNAANATDNYLKVENGGAFWGGFSTPAGCLIGGATGADNNYVLVTGLNSTLNLHNRSTVARLFTIGAVGTTANSNHLDVFSGATANLSCGVILGGSNSKFNLGDGTNISTANIGNGALTNLVYLSVASAQLNFNGGKLVSRTNNIPLVIGPGTVNLNGPATIDTTNYINSIDSVITGTGTLTKLGVGKLTLTNNNTYSGATTISAGTLALSGSGSVHSSTNLIVSNGATFDVSGVTPYSLTSGQTLKGNGVVTGAVVVASGATVAPGNSIGTLATGSETWSGGGAYEFEIDDATGTVGASPGWDWLNITGDLDIQSTSGSPYTIKVVSLNSGVAGSAANFNPSLGYRWHIATVSGSVLNFSANKFIIDDRLFVNFKAGGAFSVATSVDSKSVDLVFTSHVPAAGEVKGGWSVVDSRIQIAFTNDYGIGSVTGLRFVNCTVTATAYVTNTQFTAQTPIDLTQDVGMALPPGTVKVVTIGTKINAGLSASYNARAFDLSASVSGTIDPVTTVLEIGGSGETRQTFTGLLSAERFVSVQNGTPGLRRLTLNLNGQIFVLSQLSDGELRTLDVAAAMIPGADNTLVLVGEGPAGASAVVTVADVPVGDPEVGEVAATSLQIEMTDQTLQLSWPESKAGRILQSRSSFNLEEGWLDWPTAPKLLQGRFGVTTPTPGAPKYFRLH